MIIICCNKHRGAKVLRAILRIKNIERLNVTALKNICILDKYQ